MAIYLNSKKTSMRYNNLGASGLQVSELSFGAPASRTISEAPASREITRARAARRLAQAA